MVLTAQAKIAELKQRIKRKREEVFEYLDDHFYRSCTQVLQSVTALDASQTFTRCPKSLPDYGTYVRRPMYLDIIRKKLAQYEYPSVDDFVEDMRLLVNNAYAYNGVTSPVAAAARRMEVLMEDLFVRQLGVRPPDMRELIKLGRSLSKQTSAEVWRLVCLYENKSDTPQGARVHVNPAKFSCATQRRILELLRSAAVNREAKLKPAAAPRPPLASAPRPVPSPTAHTEVHHQPADYDVEFHNDVGVPALERVPQNVRSCVPTVRAISPVRLEEDEEDMCSEDFHPS